MPLQACNFQATPLQAGTAHISTTAELRVELLVDNNGINITLNSHYIHY